MQTKTKSLVAIAMVAVMVLTAFAPFISSEKVNAAADPDTADQTFYRYSINFYSTSTNVLYVIWDFNDGTVLDGRWEYYQQQMELEPEERDVEITAEIEAGVHAYEELLMDNGNSVFNPTHTFETADNYDVTIYAINPMGYIAEGETSPYDGNLHTNDTGFDGGLLAGITGETYDNDNRTVSGAWDSNTVTYAIMGYPTVIFDTNGGSAIEPQVVENTNVYVPATMPTAPTKEGFTFSGWYEDAAFETPYDWTAVVDHDITLYAKWTDSAAELLDHVIEYYVDGVKYREQNVQNAEETVTTIISVDGPEKEGYYTFAGWQEDGDETLYQLNDPITVSTAGKVLNAVYTHQEMYDHTLYYMLDADTQYSFTTRTNSNPNAIAIEVKVDNPTKVGYEFKGWANAINGTPIFFQGSTVSVPVDGRTLYAVFEISVDHITTFKDGNEVIATQNGKSPSSEAFADTIRIDDPTKDGYKFKGWSTTVDGEATLQKGSAITVPVAGLTLYAVWEKNAGPADNTGEIVTYGILIAGIVAVIVGLFVMPVISIVGAGAIIFAILEFLNVINLF